jgi:hypothetical protein
MKWNDPPGFRTRLISASAASMFGIVHSVHVESAASNSALGRSRCSPVRPPYSTGTGALAMRDAAIFMHTRDGSIATTFLISEG